MDGGLTLMKPMPWFKPSHWPVGDLDEAGYAAWLAENLPKKWSEKSNGRTKNKKN
jgi:hypothetical protein